MKKINIKKQRVFSGTRASGTLHIGNYFGAIKGYIDLQNRKDLECLYMFVDLHSITTPFTPDLLKSRSRDVVIDYLAAGVDPKKSIITLQSLVPEHTYLSWLLSSSVSLAQLSHLPTYKEKIKMHPDNVNLSLLSYPVLMAADILIYKSNLVPVGIDQEPHIEIAREIARKVNARFGLTIPEPHRFATEVQSVPSLQGEGKMSKSDESSTLYLSDEPEAITKKVSGIPTNSGKGTVQIIKGVKKYFDEKGVESKGLLSLMGLVKLFQGEEVRLKYEKEYQTTGVKFGLIKKDLAQSISDTLEPIREKRKELLKNPEYIDKVIKDGASKARKIAQETLKEVKASFGFYQPK